MTRRPPRRVWAGTLQFRVTALAALAVLLVLSAASVGLVLVQRALLTDGLDETLALHADAVAARLRAGDPVGSAELTSDPVVQVVGPGSAVLAGSPAVVGEPAWSFPTRHQGTGAMTVELAAEGGPARLVTRVVDGSVIRVAGGLDDVQEAAAALTRSLLVAVPISALLLAGVVWWSVGRTLRPVAQIRARVEEISGSRLDRRVPEPATQDEVANLARTMNAMLDRLSESAERQRRFVADASHELRGPLARIRSELEVDDAHPATADLAATHRSVLAEALGLQRLVEDLLLLARGDGGGLDVVRTELVDLDDVVESLAGGLRAGAAVALDTRGMAPVQVIGDAQQLGRAVANLLENAVRHARSVVLVTLREEPDGSAILAVVDDGPGIPADRREVVFERFTRLDDARATSGGGAGLGLAIAREIAARHGGSLELDPGHAPGARFVLTLPTGRSAGAAG